MKIHLFKLLLALVLILAPGVMGTNSFFSSTATITGNTFSMAAAAPTCETNPTAPVLLTPENHANADTTDVTFTWQAASTNCEGANLTYKLEAFENDNLHGTPVFASDWQTGLSFSQSDIDERHIFWHVLVQDQFGNTNRSTVFHLNFDHTAPRITNIDHAIFTPGSTNEKTAKITWNTDEPATSNLAYSTDNRATWTDLPSDTSADQTNHEREIENLLPDTKYYFRITSADEAGNSNSTSGNDYFKTDDFRTDVAPTTDVVINEFLPDPSGDDDAARPGGEWVELYNRSATTTYDLTGWYLQDADAHNLNLSLVNSTSLSIVPHGFVVVYRNGSSFSLNNTVDTVYLKDNHGAIVDSHSYSTSLGDNILENKSIARFPDGSSSWFDPIPTPLGPNQLEPTLTIDLTGDRHYFSFGIQGISAYKSFDYQVTYDTDGTTQGLQGSISLNNQSDYNHPQTIFGSCSSGGTCVYNSGVKNINLSVTLTGTDGSLLTLKKTVE